MVIFPDRRPDFARRNMRVVAVGIVERELLKVSLFLNM
jgi:hypothetical protein